MKVIMEVQRQTHGRIVPLLPEEIVFGSKTTALGMWGIPDFVFQRDILRAATGGTVKLHTCSHSSNTHQEVGR